MPARKESPIRLELRLNDDGALLRRRRLEGATQKSYSPTGDDVSDVDGRRPRAVVEVRARTEVMRISVFGLGYVGSVSAACLSRDGHDVIGVDLNQAKVDLIQQGRSPIVEPGLSELIAAGRAQGTLQAWT